MNKDKIVAEPSERTLKFALLIQQKISSAGVQYDIRSENQGISDTDIILLVESWLERVKENFKDNIKKGIQFHNKDQR